MGKHAPTHTCNVEYAMNCNIRSQIFNIHTKNIYICNTQLRHVTIVTTSYYQSIYYGTTISLGDYKLSKIVR